MKLRIQGNSLRLWISKSELAKFVETGHLQETDYFGQSEARNYLTLLLDMATSLVSMSRHRPAR